VNLVLAAQAVLAASYLLGAVGLLLAAAVGTGDFQGLLDPGVQRFGDPKDWIPPIGPDSVWNPLAWIFGLARTVSFFIGPLALVVGLIGLAYLVRTNPGSQRRSFVWLLLGTMGCVALVVIPLTPYGAQLGTWLVD
jgi:hypothetical protein